MLKKLIGVGMALTMSLTVGLGFANKVDAAYILIKLNEQWTHICR